MPGCAEMDSFIYPFMRAKGSIVTKGAEVQTAVVRPLLGVGGFFPLYGPFASLSRCHWKLKNIHHNYPERIETHLATSAFHLIGCDSLCYDHDTRLTDVLSDTPSQFTVVHTHPTSYQTHSPDFLLDTPT